MQIAGEQRIAAAPPRVWEALNDPDVLLQCIPGCQSLEKVANDSFRATAEIKIGPIGARFTGTVQLTDLDPPNGYTIVGQGSGGMAGSAKGSARVRLASDGEGTLLTYAVDADVGGRLAQLGGPIMDATARRLSAAFFARFEQVIARGSAGGAVPLAERAATAVAPSGASAAVSTKGPGSPLAAILAVALAAVIGFLIGRAQGGAASDWQGVAIGLLLLVVGSAGFAMGRSDGHRR